MTVDIDKFKTMFARNFTFGTELPDILDTEITKASDEANAVFNPGIYANDDIKEMAFYYLTAHFLYSDISSNSAAVYNQSSRSVGSVSESLSIPDWMNQGEFAFFSTTYFGQKFLNLSKPYLDGAIVVVEGGTTF
jgi:hypothetical protein